MSSERNVELVRRLFEAHNRGPAAVSAVYEEIFHPDLEWVPVIVGGPEGASYRGREGLMRWYAEREDSFEGATVDVEVCRAVGPELVLVLGRSLARGRASGVEVDEEVGIVLQFRDGLVWRDQAYGSHAEAEMAADEKASEAHA